MFEKGEILKVAYEVEVHSELSDKKREQIRNRAISDSIWGSIMAATYDPGKAGEVHIATQKGFNMGNKIINSFENRPDVRIEYFQIGHQESLDKIKEIEASPDFVRWITDYEIEQLKK
jgi:glucuronate isomerase